MKYLYVSVNENFETLHCFLHVNLMNEFSIKPCLKMNCTHVRSNKGVQKSLRSLDMMSFINN